MFSDTLLKYMKLSQCSSKNLAEKARLEQSSISRYLNGTRVPDTKSDILARIAGSLFSFIDITSKGAVTEQEILDELLAAATSDNTRFPHEIFSRNLGLLLLELGFSQAELARRLFLSGPTLSRILAGNYSTRDPEGTIQRMTSVVNQACAEDPIVRKRIDILLEQELGVAIRDTDMRTKNLTDWLSGASRAENEALSMGFVRGFQNCDPKDYVRAYRLDEVRLPRLPWQVPTTKKYVGPVGMKKGIRDFLRSTILSTSTDDVVIYMNTPVDHFADDSEVYEKIMWAGWLLVSQGHKVYVIHNVNRPQVELKIGIETWLPLYMTGQIEPYYYDGGQDTLIYDILFVSGSAAYSGRAYKGAEDLGEYVLSKSRKSIREARSHADIMLSQSKRLVRIFNKDNLDEYERLFLSHLKDQEPVHNTSISLPIETIDEELLLRILARNNVSPIARSEILDLQERRRGTLEEMLSHCEYEEIIMEYQLSRSLGTEIPLDIPQYVCEKPIYYAPDEWKMHLEQTEQFARTHKNFILKREERPAFANIHMHVRKNKYAIVDRYKGDELHFVFYHPLLIQCFYEFDAPIYAG